MVKNNGGANASAGLSNTLSFVSLGLLVVGLLLFFEVARPFRDLSIDGPIAMSAWSAGSLLGVVVVWLRRGSRVLSISALGLNLFALATVSAVLASLTR